jgi:hypothetical protein
MTYDATRGLVVMAGGAGAAGALNDVWTWNGTAWAQVTTQGAFPARRDHALWFDQRRNRAVVFGGLVLGQPRADMWELDPDGRWAPITLAGPPARSGAVALYAGPLIGGLVFGGRGTSALLNDLWGLR